MSQLEYFMCSVVTYISKMQNSENKLCKLQSLSYKVLIRNGYLWVAAYLYTKVWIFVF